VRVDLLSNRAVARDVQVKLSIPGLYQGAIDGLFGPLSQKALLEWRIARYTPTHITDAELQELSVIKYEFPENKAEFDEFYGVFEYTSLSSGLIEMDMAWARKNLMLEEFPFFGNMYVNIRVADSLTAIGTELNATIPLYEIRLLGSYNPRHKMHDASRSLSTHAYAAAVDLNWDTNAYGTVGDMPLKIVEAFKRNGWQWGGDWADLEFADGKWRCPAPSALKKSDPMHFQAGKDW